MLSAKNICQEKYMQIMFCKIERLIHKKPYNINGASGAFVSIFLTLTQECCTKLRFHFEMLNMSKSLLGQKQGRKTQIFLFTVFSNSVDLSNFAN